MKITKQLRTDLQDIEENLPGLYCRINHKNDIIVIDGYLDICDTKGNFWDSFYVMILYKFNSLYNVPIVIETSNKIPREDSRHISEEGVCCVDLPHKLKFQALKGINNK